MFKNILAELNHGDPTEAFADPVQALVDIKLICITLEVWESHLEDFELERIGEAGKPFSAVNILRNFVKDLNGVLPTAEECAKALNAMQGKGK